jgi:hypothetical protein
MSIEECVSSLLALLFGFDSGGRFNFLGVVENLRL